MANVDKFFLEVTFSNISLAQVRSNCSKQFPIFWDVRRARLIIQCYEEIDSEHTVQYQFFTPTPPHNGELSWDAKFKRAKFPKKVWKYIELKFESIR